MRVEVSFRNLAPSDSLRSYSEDKMGKLKRFLVKPIDAHVILSKDGFLHIAEASVRTSDGSFGAKVSSEDDLYAAIDLVADKLAKQARRSHTKRADHRAPKTGTELARAERSVADEKLADLDAELDALGD